MFFKGLVERFVLGYPSDGHPRYSEGETERSMFRLALKIAKFQNSQNVSMLCCSVLRDEYGDAAIFFFEMRTAHVMEPTDISERSVGEIALATVVGTEGYFSVGDIRDAVQRILLDIVLNETLVGTEPEVVEIIEFPPGDQCEL